MAQRVEGDLYYELDGQLSEIKRQLRQPSGYPFDLERLKSGLQVLIEGRFFGVCGSFADDYDMWTDGWVLLKNSPRRLTSSSPYLELVPFLRDGEKKIGGDEMMRRARLKLANYGQEDAEFLLKDPGQIPMDFRPFCLVFPGTVWLDSDGNREFASLDCFGGRWRLHFILEYGLDFDQHRLIRPHK